MDNRPIGVFDSGVGGLTVVNALVQSISSETIYYVGDTARVPYGNKSRKRIQQYSEEIIDWLIKKDCKMVIVACNTASSLAIDYLQKKFSLPIIGVIDPGVQLAISRTKSQSIGVTGTHATIESNAYGEKLKFVRPKINIINQSCPLFVPLVEEGLTKGPITKLIVESYLSHFKSTDVDTLILGCTHYPILTAVIKEVVGKNISLIDSGKATAEVVMEILNKNGLRSEDPNGGVYSFVTDSKESFQKVITKALTPEINISIKSINRIDIG